MSDVVVQDRVQVPRLGDEYSVGDLGPRRALA